MATILIKNLPKVIHKKLKELAARNHRSMNKEALLLLQEALEPSYEVAEFPPTERGKFPINDELIRKARQAGRS